MDIVQIVIGLFFVTWAWSFPRWLARVRTLMAKKGELDRFDSRFPAALVAFGSYGVPALGLVLVVSGIVFVAAGG